MAGCANTRVMDFTDASLMGLLRDLRREIHFVARRADAGTNHCKKLLGILLGCLSQGADPLTGDPEFCSFFS